MNKVFSILFLLLATNLVAQPTDLSGLVINNVQPSTYAKGIQIKFDYQYLDQFPDSLSFAMTARLRTSSLQEVAVSKPIYFMKRPKSDKAGDRSITIPYRDIGLNEGSHNLRIELEAFHTDDYNHLLASTNYFIQQPKRYTVNIQIDGGQITDLKSSGQTWDAGRLFSNKNEIKLPDPQWWVYIESTYLNEPSPSNENSLVAPSAYFSVIILQSEKLYIKLYDEDGFINRDDLIGTFRIHHPQETMRESLLNQNAENVSKFNVHIDKQLLILNQ